MTEHTTETVGLRIREAWDTLRRIPEQSRRQSRAAWPDVVQDYSDAYGYTAATVRMARASPQAIDRMHEAFGWFPFVADRNLVRAMWLTCGCGMGPKRAGDIMGAHRNSVRIWRDSALRLIVAGLNSAPKRPDVARCAERA